VKKRQPDLPWSDIDSDHELRSIFAALEGKPQQLATRLRAGNASKVEQALAADLIEGKIKPRRPRSGSDTESRLLVALFVRLTEGILTVPNMEKAYRAAFPEIPDIQPPKLRRTQRKFFIDFVREFVGKKSKVMSIRQAYNALTASSWQPPTDC
jgi:hypothetical protein